MANVMARNVCVYDSYAAGFSTRLIILMKVVLRRAYFSDLRHLYVPHDCEMRFLDPPVASPINGKVCGVKIVAQPSYLLQLYKDSQGQLPPFCSQIVVGIGEDPRQAILGAY